MQLVFKLATANDIADIIQMLHDDDIGHSREHTEEIHLEKYLQAFEKILADPHQELTVVKMDGKNVATFQLTFIPYLSHQGALRAQVEAVRTNSAYRGMGIGTKVFEYIIARAKKKECYLLQLTSDKRRVDAIRFYNKIGFVATHEGMKLKL